MQKSVAAVSLPAIERNALAVKKILKNKKMFAVVKADAYGHGAEEVALRLSRLADGFCVAIIEEGIALRVAGVQNPVLVFTPPSCRDDVVRAEYYGLTLTVNSVETARLIKGAPCHIKVNTGMNRTGCNLSGLADVLGAAGGAQGIYSHLYAPHISECANVQLNLFKRAVGLAKKLNPDICAHLSASGGICLGEEFLFDGARPGLLLYGYAPKGFTAPVTPAMKIYAPLVQRTRFIGGGIGYAAAKKKYGTLSTYRYGYADGLPRKTPLGVSPLCMDGFISETRADKICVMDDADKIAERCGTISYEILCSATKRCAIEYER